MSSTFRWAYAGNVSPGVNPGTGKFSLFVPDGYVNPNYIQFSKTDNTSQDADSLLSTLLSKTSFVVAVDSSKYIQLQVSGSADYGTFYRFNISDSFEIVKLGTFSVDDVVQISDDVPGGGGGGGGGGGDPPPEEETDVSWVIVGDFPNKVAHSTNSGRTWTQVTPIVPLSKATCGKKGGSLILIGGELTSTGRSVYSVETFGDTWTPVDIGLEKCNAINYNGTEWIVVGKGRFRSECVFTSPDGIVWTPQTTVLLEEALNVYWMQNTWIVVGKAFVVGSPCIFVNSNSYWIGIDAALIYENLQFDTVKKVVKYQDKLLFLGELDGAPSFGSLEWTTSPTQSELGTSFSITPIGDVKYNGNYILTFDFQTNKVNVSSDGGQTWAPIDSMTNAEVPTSDLIIAQATQHSSQTVNSTLINAFFTQYANSIGENAYDLEGARTSLTNVKGVIDKCNEYFSEAQTIKVEIQDLKIELQGIYDQVEDYLEKGLPLEIVKFNAEKSTLRTLLNANQTTWGLPAPGSESTFDDLGVNYGYTVALQNYETAITNNTVNGAVQINNTTLGILNTFIALVNYHLDVSKDYKENLKKYIPILTERDILYKEGYEYKLEQLNDRATTILELITEKFNRAGEINTLLQDYVTLIPQSHYDANQLFDSLNFNLTDVFNAPFNFGAEYVAENPWIINLVRLNIVPFEYSFNYEVEGVTTVDVKTKFETEINGYVNEFYAKFPGTTFDKDATDVQFTEIQTLFTEIETLKDESSTLKDSVLDLYNFEEAQQDRTDEIVEYDAYVVDGVSYNIIDKLEEYIQRDIDKLDDLEEIRLEFQPIVDELNDAVEAAYEASRLAAIEKEQKRIAEAAAIMAYLQSEEYKSQQQALLQQLQDQQASQAAIQAQQQLVAEAEAARFLAASAQQEAENERILAEQITLEKQEELIAQSIANEAAMAARALAEAQAKRQAEIAVLQQLSTLRTTFATTRLNTARLLFYMFYELKVYYDAIDSYKKPYYFYSLIRTESTIETQYQRTLAAALQICFKGLHSYNTFDSYTVDGWNEISRNYDNDFGSIKQTFIRIYNSFADAKPDIEAYLNSINITSQIAILKAINNLTGTSIETKYNALRTAITNELENLTTVTDVTLTIANGVTIGFDSRTPLGSVSLADQTTFFNNVTTTVPSENITSIKKITWYLYQLIPYVSSIKSIAEAYSYVSSAKTELTDSRSTFATELEGIVDFSNATSVSTLFTNVDSALSQSLTSLNGQSLNTSITNVDDPGSILLPSYAARFERRNKNIQKLADIYSDDNDLLSDTNIVRGIATYFSNQVFSFNVRVSRVRESVVNDTYQQLRNLKNAMIGLFSPYATSPRFQAETLYEKYQRFSIFTVPEVSTVLKFSYQIQYAISRSIEYRQAKNNYYTAYAGCIANDIPPYPDALTQPVNSDPGFTQWFNSRTHYMTMESYKKQYGDTIFNTLETLSIVLINRHITTLSQLETEWITSITPQYIQDLQTADQQQLLTAYRSNARNYIAAVSPTIPIATFPSSEDVTKFKLTGITFTIRNTANILNGYSTETFETQNISQIRSSIFYFRGLFAAYSLSLVSLSSKIRDITNYKASVLRLTAAVNDLKDTIDRKERIVTNYLNGPTPLDLVISDGSSKPFIMSIKPTNTSYWEEVTGYDERDYTLFDNNWGYFVGDKVSYNKKVYRLKNAVPVRTFEDNISLSGNPPIFPKTDSETVFSIINTDYWTFISPYFETTGRPGLNELRSYNGDLYKCIEVYKLEETVAIPPSDTVHWAFIPTNNYVLEGGIQYYSNTDVYVTDEEVLFKYQLRSLDNTVPYRLGKFKPVKTVTESQPTRFRLPRLEIGDTLRTDRGTIDPSTGQVDPDTVPYEMTLTGGNRTTQIPRYGSQDDDPWRIDGLLRDLRYSVALGPEMAILRAYTRRQQVDISLYRPDLILGENAPDDSQTVWNGILSSFETQSARLDIAYRSPSSSLEYTMRQVYTKAYDSVCYILDKYIQDMVYLVGELNRLKQTLYSIYQPHIEDNLSDFLDANLSTPNNFVFRDLGIGERDSVFTPYYDRHKLNYERIKDNIQFILDSMNRLLALDLVTNTITDTTYTAISRGGGITSESSLGGNEIDVRYHPIGITDWQYLRSSQYVDNEELNETEFPIMSRVKRVIAEIAKKPAYINNTAHLVPSNDPTVNGLYKFTLGLAIIARGLTSVILDLNGLPGTTDPLEQAGQNKRNMQKFVRTVQNNARSGSVAVQISREFIESIEVIRSNIITLEENVQLLDDVNRGVIPEPPPINVGPPPTTISDTTSIPPEPSRPILRDLIADNRGELDDARKSLQNAEKALEDIKRTGSAQPTMPGKDMIEITEKGRPPTKAVTHTIVNTTYNRGAAGLLKVSGSPGTGTRKFGTDFQGIPPTTSTTVNNVKAQAMAITDTTSSLVTQTEDALKKELDARRVAFDAQLQESQRIALQNAEIELENSQTMRNYNTQIDNYNKQVAELNEKQRQAKIDFEKADVEYRNAVRTSNARAQEILDVRSRNAKILLENQEALRNAQSTLAQARNAQRAFVSTELTKVPIPAVTRTQVVANAVRRIAVVQFAGKQFATISTMISRASIALGSSSAGRFASRVAGSRSGQLISGLGGFLLEPAINIGLGFYTAATEGLFDD
jgi:hypothetical protein